MQLPLTFRTVERGQIVEKMTSFQTLPHISQLHRFETKHNFFPCGTPAKRFKSLQDGFWTHQCLQNPLCGSF